MPQRPAVTHRTALAIALAAALALLLPPAPPAGAMCAVLDGPRLLEGTVEGCRGLGEPLREAAGAAAADRLAGAGVLVTFVPARSRQLNLEAIGSEAFAIGPWQELAAEAARPAEYLLSAAGARCADYPAATRARFLELLACCDTLPPQDAACILEVPALVPPPPELLAVLAAAGGCG
jgi:hypothetical protein